MREWGAMRSTPLTAVTALLLATLPALPAQDGHVHTNREGARLLPLPREEGVWHFVVFGDRTGGPPEGIEILKKAVRDTNLLDPDLVMTVGDLVQGYNGREKWLTQAAEFKAAMDGLRRPWFPVAGNHDIYWRGPDRPAGEHEGDFEQHFGPLWYWFRHKDAAFVVLYSDEGDAATGEKGFGLDRFDRMSREQLAWLDETLAATKALDHVFVFLHHPRWITGVYPSSDWDDVHRRLAAAGNVKAVFAGHIHRMRFDGKRDGIEYFTAGATGASYKFELPEAGWLHHFLVVTVRKPGIAVAALPVGAVIDPKEMTPERLRDVDRLLAQAPPEVTQPFAIAASGEGRGTYALRLSNPSTRPVEITASPEAGGSGARFVPDHVHLTLAAGDSAEIAFEYERAAGGLDDALRGLSLALQRDYLDSAARVRLPEARHPLKIALVGPAPEPAAPGHARLDGKSACLAIAGPGSRIPDGPFTVEGWLRPRNLKGRQPFLSKAQESEWGLFLADGKPRWTVHAGGRYATSLAEKPISADSWHHLAGVFDGAELRLYVDGTLASSAPASGKRTLNPHPAYAGADPDGKGEPMDFFDGAVDEIRISSGARYQGPAFTPVRRPDPDEATLLLLHCDRDLGPWSPDSGPLQSHALRRGAAASVPGDAAAND